jgi:hypothetical protein
MFCSEARWRLREDMSNRFKDDEGEAEPIITLTPDSMIHPNRPNQTHYGYASHGGPTAEKNVEMLGEMDKLHAQIQELTRKNQELEAEVAQLRPGKPADTNPSEAGQPGADAGSSDAKDQEIAELKDKYLRAFVSKAKTI